MGESYGVNYYLPVTSVRYVAAISHVADSLAPDGAKKDPVFASSSAVFNVAADRETPLTALVKTGGLLDVTVDLELTADQRLTSSGSESTGHLGKVASGVVATAVFGAAALAGVPTGGASFAALAAAVVAGRKLDHVERLDEGDADGEKGKPGKKDLAQEDPILAKYRGEFPTEAEHAARYAKLLRDVRAGLLDKSERLAVAETSADRRTLIAELKTLESVKSETEGNLDRLRRHFETWRASKVSTRNEDLATEVPFHDLPFAPDGKLTVEQLTDPQKRIWQDYGVAVVVHGVVAPEPPNGALPVPPSIEGVWYREPRRATWSIWKKNGAEGERVSTQSGLILDRYCQVKKVAFRRSLLARRSVKTSFGADGTLTGFESGSTSAIAAGVEAMEGLPAGVTNAVEQANKLRDQFDTLRSQDLDERVARAKAQLSLKQDELALAGLAATESDHVELERLKQQVAIAENSAKLVPETLDAQAIRREIELVTAERELAVARRQAAAEAELSELRLDIERLQAVWQKANPGKDVG